MRILHILVFGMLALPTMAQVTGELRFHQLRSNIFSNQRTIRVWLPPGYDAPRNHARRYPVLYLNDGQNVFDAATSVFNGMEWKADETATALIRENRVAPFIIVGVDTVGRRGRATEYLPFADKYLNPPEPDVRGGDYPRFMVEEVLPLVNRLYRTRHGRNDTAIGGSSYGAVAALYTAIQEPNYFGKVLLESPSLYIGDGRLLTELRGVRRWPARLYVGVGTNEGGRKTCDAADLNFEAVQDVRKLETIARAHPAIKVEVVVKPCAVHNEDAWARRLPKALQFLFPTR